MKIEVYVGVEIWPDGYVHIDVFGDEEAQRKWDRSHHDEEDGEPNDPCVRIITMEGDIEVDDSDIADYACADLGFIDPDNPPLRGP